jgi:hypothetical protein
MHITVLLFYQADWLTGIIITRDSAADARNMIVFGRRY